MPGGRPEQKEMKALEDGLQTVRHLQGIRMRVQQCNLQASAKYPGEANLEAGARHSNQANIQAGARHPNQANLQAKPSIQSLQAGNRLAVG